MDETSKTVYKSDTDPLPIELKVIVVSRFS